jgi:hypothetical protein
MTGYGTVGIRVEKIELSLELLYRGPIIVSLQNGQILAPAKGQNGFEILCGPDISVPQNGHNSIRIAAMEIHDDDACSVGRTVFAADDFIVKIHICASTLSIAWPINRSWLYVIIATLSFIKITSRGDLQNCGLPRHKDNI